MLSNDGGQLLSHVGRRVRLHRRLQGGDGSELPERPLGDRLHLGRARLRHRQVGLRDVDAELTQLRELEQRLLALGIAVEQPGRHARPAGDLVHAGPAVALLEEHQRRRFDDVFEPARRSSSHHDPNYK